MKELEKQTRVEHHEEKQQEQKYRLLGDLLHHPGLSLYEYDPVSRVLKKAELIEKVKAVEIIPIPKAPAIKKPKGQLWNPEYMLQQHAANNKRTVANIMFKDGCDYFYALNDMSAAKKLEKMIRKRLIVNR